MSDLFTLAPTVQKSRTVVRLSTSAWLSGNAVFQSRCLRLMKRRSCGECPEYFIEDANNIGASEMLANIVNFNESPDGLYVLSICNVRKDWETGHVDDYDYKLVPYQPPA